jgi:hypothetical protein
MDHATGHTTGTPVLGPIKKTRPCLTYGVYDQRAIQKEISGFTARLRDQEIAVACSPVQRSVFIGGHRVVVGAHGIA